MVNPNCDGAGPHVAGEVKKMPAGGGSNLILCRHCWIRELIYRGQRNKTLEVFAQFDLPDWNEAEVYDAG